jgi:prepilin-type N-terminal cleavage/methylation domain-containing protein
MNKLLRKREEGFTLIEVLIVLAIAGLIMLIVFLAVPALQRNSRNTQRTNDAALVGSALNECLTNRNGQVNSCNETTELEALGLDINKLTQLITVEFNNAFPAAGELDRAHFAFGLRCQDDGADTQAATARAAVVLFRVEVQGNNDGVQRCIEV